MVASNLSFPETAECLPRNFFPNHPNRHLRDQVNRALAQVLKLQKSFPGKPEGWTAGILFAIGSDGTWGCGVPDVPNSELEKAFDVDISTIYKRSWAVKRLLGMTEL